MMSINQMHDLYDKMIMVVNDILIYHGIDTFLINQSNNIWRIYSKHDIAIALIPEKYSFWTYVFFKNNILMLLLLLNHNI